MEKGAKLTELMASLTAIAIFKYAPTSATAGVPRNSPVCVLKVAHAGLFAIAKVNGAPSGSAAVG